MEPGMPVFTSRIDSVEHEHVEVEVKIDAPSESLDAGDRSALALGDSLLVVGPSA